MNELVKQAVAGNREALEQVVVQIQDLIYNLAIRMLWHPDDAKDATQDILIRVITNLGSFKYESAFTTWVYRIATNSLINLKKQRAARGLNFEAYAEQLHADFSDNVAYTSNKAEQKLLVQEAKVGCSNAMLQCLTKEARIAYILGEILEFKSEEGAYITEVSAVTFRKRLSRARKELHHFLNQNCGLVNKTCACRCHRKVDGSIRRGIIKPDNLYFAKQPRSKQLIQAIEKVEDEVSLYQSNPSYQAPERFLQEVKRLISKREDL